MDMTLAKFPTASPITHRPRDSVAQFFGDADFTQQLLILGELSPLKSPSRSPKVQSPIKQAQSPTPLQKFKALPLNSPTGPRSTVDSFFASPRPAVSSNLRYSVSASDIAESPEQQVSQPPRRDSVATFFGNKQMYANSPVKFNTPVRASRRDSVANFFRSSQTTASPEAMSSQAMETSMDAFASSQSVDMSLETESIDHSDDANVSMDMITGTASANMSDAMDMTHVQFSQSTCVLSGSDMDSMPRSSSWSTQESMSRSGSFEQQSSQEDTISKFFNHEGERPEQPEVDAVSDYAFDMGTPKATLDTAFSAAGKGSARGKRLSMVTPKAASKRNTPVKQSAGKTMPMRTPTASSKPPSRTPTKIPSARKATPKNAIDKQESFERTPTAAQPQSPMTRSRTRNLSSPALPSQASAKSTKSRNSRKSIGGRGLFETPPQMLNEHVAEAAEQSDYDDDALDNVSPIRDFRDSVQDLAQEEYDAPEESVLVEGELLNENEFNQPQDDESQQEDLNENADSPDHLDDNSEKNNIDLMDEHLSVVDDSFCQENFGVFEEQVEIEDLDQFLSVTGLLIADVSIPEFPEPVTLDYPASELDYLKAAVTTWPEYSLFEWGCKELIKYIETGKEEIELSKQEIQMEAPLVFVEYSQGTAQEREELVHSMKQLEDACFQQAKSQFLDWKTHFVEAHETPLYANLESLQSDEQVIDEELKRVSGTLEEIRQTHGDLDGDVKALIAL